ncbi:GNAT family N-acetyltransferase [Paucibacter soli]|uniref:GNAT family N-acetyltransferase n=1 Tax=Paucibacter soli TaxID=3133433 RepID=UPI0030A08E36
MSKRHISLRHVRESDLPLLIEQATHTEWRGEFESTRMNGEQSIRKRFAEDGFSSEANERLLVCDEAGAVIGSVSHFLAHRYSTAREIGWSIHDPALRGQGYGSAAAQALVDYLFLNFEQVHRVCCNTAPGNLGSRRIAEKAGMQFEGLLRGVVFIRGEYADGAQYAILRPDWQARRALKA